MENNTGDSLSVNTKAALAVVLGPTIIGPLVLIFLNKDKFVRFNALQILALILVMGTLQVVIGLIPFINALSGLITILIFTLWLVLIYKAWLGQKMVLPIFGEIAEKLVGKV